MHRVGSILSRVAAGATGPRGDRPRLPFWILAGFVTLAFLTGGSSRTNVPLLFVLRPVAVLVAAWGLATMSADAWRRHRPVLLVAAATVLLTALHLVPLPPAIWQVLPGHAPVRGIDAAAGLAGEWRPLSLVPSKTLNALYALTVPAAALLIAVQLTAADRVRILYALLALAALSAIIGLLQAAGVSISLYHVIDDPRAIEAAGLFANQNHQAALLATMLPMLAVAPGVGHRHDGRRQGGGHRLVGPLAAIAGVAITLLLIVTGSRAGLVLGLLAIGLTLFYGLLRIDLLERLPQRTAAMARLAVGATVVGVAALVTLLTARGLAFDRLENVQADLRPRLWASIVPILPDYQPWGSGIGSYVEVYRSREPFALLRATYSNHAHNEYLEVALTAGVPGLLLLLVAGVLLAVALWRNRRGAEVDRLFARLGVAVIVILAAASVTDYPLRTPLLAAVFAIAAAWCAGPATAVRAGPLGRDASPTMPTDRTGR